MIRQEMETVLRYDAMEDCWYGWSCVSKHIRAMKRSGWTMISEQGGYVYMKAPGHSVKVFKAQKTQRRSLTDEEKLELRKRLMGNSDTKSIPGKQG